MLSTGSKVSSLYVSVSRLALAAVAKAPDRAGPRSKELADRDADPSAESEDRSEVGDADKGGVKGGGSGGGDRDMAEGSDEAEAARAGRGADAGRSLSRVKRDDEGGDPNDELSRKAIDSFVAPKLAERLSKPAGRSRPEAARRPAAGAAGEGEGGGRDADDKVDTDMMSSDRSDACAADGAARATVGPPPDGPWRPRGVVPSSAAAAAASASAAEARCQAPKAAVAELTMPPKSIARRGLDEDGPPQAGAGNGGASACLVGPRG